jgi:hypothetical protein
MIETGARLLSAQLSRRRLMRSAACAAGATAMFGASAQVALAAKVPQKAVLYQDTPKGDHSCANCQLFEPPDACKNVEGPVKPEGWCSIWVPK